MYKKYLFKKRLVVGIIFLFTGMSVIPSNGTIGRNSESLETNKENNYESYIDFLWKFYPVNDTSISHRDSDFNYGSYKNLHVRNEYGSDGSTGWAGDSLIKFDVSSIPFGTTISSAKLKLFYFDTWDSDPSGRNLRLYRATNDWDENTVTWNTQPYYASESTSYAIVPSSPGIWMTWDVTNDIQDFIDGSKTNYGWKITDDNYWGHADIPIVYFYSKEYGSNIPYLDIVYYGNWLYVGGSGEGNYTHIQDAIDNASNGDTVFVYDDSSPYYENVAVDKSINLIGEDRNTTVIDAIGSEEFPDALEVSADGVNIRGFMIKNSLSAGIDVFSNNNIIIHNTIINNTIGIFLQESSFNYIRENNIDDNGIGIVTFDCDYNMFFENDLFINEIGIGLFESTHSQIVDNTIKCDNITTLSMGIILQEFSINNKIIGNHISNFEFGISIRSSINTIISGNNLSSNSRFGLYLEHCSVYNDITRNNFINNGYEKSFKIRGNAFFIDSEFVYYSNTWNENYWDDWIGLKHKLLTIFPYRIPGRWGIVHGIGILFPTSDFDFNPAKEPYNIL